VKEKNFINVLFLFSLLFIIRFTMLPSSSLGIGISKGELNLIPFKTISGMLFSMSLPNLIVNIGGNIVLFMPFGFALPLKFPKLRSMKTVIWAGLSLSIMIECIQLMMPQRCADIDDVILNTLGTYLGFLLMRKSIK